jgi:hypothetical protein
MGAMDEAVAGVGREDRKDEARRGVDGAATGRVAMQEAMASVRPEATLAATARMGAVAATKGKKTVHCLLNKKILPFSEKFLSVFLSVHILYLWHCTGLSSLHCLTSPTFSLPPRCLSVPIMYLCISWKKDK